MRFSAMRIQSFIRRRKERYLYNSAARIQRFYRSRKNEWLQTFLLLVNASQKLVAKVYRGYKSRKELPLSVLRELRRGNQPVSQLIFASTASGSVVAPATPSTRRVPHFLLSESGRVAISAPRPCLRPKLGHDPRAIHSTVSREHHLTQTTRDHELKGA